MTNELQSELEVAVVLQRMETEAPRFNVRHIPCEESITWGAKRARSFSQNLCCESTCLITSPGKKTTQ
ncbi:hypothetical protein chiPu_0002145 [Chiloscyllium punctatum]|uniref:Uncharacterized protein n=1 Tax=Chiloscyllium punctatum TaxID=137246 RepID=A0A401S027_CHIPU|nr:hypothetical protein [Chiloscyllium punctatum]